MRLRTNVTPYKGFNPSGHNAQSCEGGFVIRVLSDPYESCVREVGWAIKVVCDGEWLGHKSPVLGRAEGHISHVLWWSRS